MQKENRRKFITKSTIAGAGIIAGLHSHGIEKPIKNSRSNKIHIFTKCLQFLSYEEMAKVVAEQGFEGADLTVRPEGQVLPENVATDLPKVVKALRKNGIGTNMVTTAINDPDAPSTIKILKAMANLDIKYYRMGYLKYNSKLSITKNLEIHKVTLKKLAKLNREYGVHGDYQNHSGDSIGAPVWDLYMLLKDQDPEYIGVQYDIRHATVEGAKSWSLGLKLLAPWVKTTDIKDFLWEKNVKDNWVLKNIPLGSGMVNFNEYFSLYKSLNIDAPISIHYEYDLGGAEHGSRNPDMNLNSIKKYLKKDLIFLQNQLT